MIAHQLRELHAVVGGNHLRRLSPIMIEAAFVFPPTTLGMTLASAHANLAAIRG